MEWKKAVDLIWDQLAACIQRAGHGTISKLEAELGLHSGYFRKARQGHVLDFLLLLRVLQFLNVSPEVFFEDALMPRGTATADPLREFGRNAEESVIAYPEIDAALSGREFDLTAPNQPTAKKRCLELLQAIPSEPLIVQRQARNLCIEATLRNDLPLFLKAAMTWAAVFIHLGSFEPGRLVLWRGIQAARHHQEDVLLAEFYLRTAQVESRSNQFQSGIRLLKEAVVKFANAGQPANVSQTLFMLGNLNGKLGNSPESMANFEAAINFLPGDQHRKRLAISAGRSLEAWKTRQDSWARKYLGDARKCLVWTSHPKLDFFLALLEAQISEKTDRDVDQAAEIALQIETFLLDQDDLSTLF